MTVFPDAYAHLTRAGSKINEPSVLEALFKPGGIKCHLSIEMQLSSWV